MATEDGHEVGGECNRGTAADESGGKESDLSASAPQPISNRSAPDRVDLTRHYDSKRQPRLHPHFSTLSSLAVPETDVDYRTRILLTKTAMSASSGITASAELLSAFSDAVTSQSVRFLKISIRNGHSACLR